MSRRHRAVASPPHNDRLLLSHASPQQETRVSTRPAQCTAVESNEPERARAGGARTAAAPAWLAARLPARALYPSLAARHPARAQRTARVLAALAAAGCFRGFRGAVSIRVHPRDGSVASDSSSAAAAAATEAVFHHLGISSLWNQPSM